MREATTEPSLVQLRGYLQGHRGLRRDYQADLRLERRLNRGLPRGLSLKQRMQYGAPTAMMPEYFGHLVYEVIQATGVQRKPGESIEAFARAALKGKTIGVIGSRYGLLQKIFELFGAKTYGVDASQPAARTAQSRGLNVRQTGAENIHEAFAGHEPDFLVSFYFFAPHYWTENGERKNTLKKIMDAMHMHSTPQTVHVHQTFGEPVPFPGFETLEQKESFMGRLTLLKKGTR